MDTILISAYACEPNKGSEPGLGWNWSIELSKYFNVIVITRSNNREVIENELSKLGNNNIKFYYCDVSKHLSFWKKGQRGVHLYYWLWQKQCYKLAKHIYSEIKFEYAMSLTFGNMWLPTYLDKLPSKFIWGPLGGGEGVPKALLSVMNKKQKIFEMLRNVNKIFPVTNLRFYTICNKSDIIVVRTEDSKSCIPLKYRSKCITILETGISSKDISYFKNLTGSTEKYNEMSFVISGRMVPFKLFPLAIEAFFIANKSYPEATLNIIGDGPDREKCELLVKQLNLQESVVFHGMTSREEALNIMAKSRAVIVTSSREGGSWILFEAMLSKKPIICFNTSGMAVTVDDSIGYLIEVCTYEDAVNRFAKRIIQVIENDTEALEKGEKAYYRVIKDFTWQARVEKLLKFMGGGING